MKITDLIVPAQACRQKSQLENRISLANLFVLQAEEINEFEAVIYDPVICLILQGAKTTTIGD